MDLVLYLIQNIYIYFLCQFLTRHLLYTAEQWYMIQAKSSLTDPTFKFSIKLTGHYISKQNI